MPSNTSMNENFFTEMEMGNIEDDSEQCIVDDFGGKSHSYGLCVTPPIGLKTDECKNGEGYSFDFDCMGKNFGEMINWLKSKFSEKTVIN